MDLHIKEGGQFFLGMKVVFTLEAKGLVQSGDDMGIVLEDNGVAKLAFLIAHRVAGLDVAHG